MASRIKTFYNVAHGGAPLLCPPGNTIASLRKALEVGAQMLEVSVRHTRDEVLVMEYEAVRMVGGREVPISEKSFSEWQSLAAEGEEPLAQLSEAFDLAARAGVGLMLNYRDTGVESLLARHIRQSRFPLDSLLISGAGETTRKILHGLDPRIPLSHTLDLEDAGQVNAKLLSSLDTDAVTWHHRLLAPPVVKVLAMRQIAVYATGVELSEDMRKMREAGVDGIVTSQPDLLSQI